MRAVFETNVFGAAAVIDGFTPLLEGQPGTGRCQRLQRRRLADPEHESPDSRWTMLAYPMCKAALNMLTIQYARAYPRRRVNSATPGLTATEFTGPRDAGPTIEQLRAAGMQSTPSKKAPRSSFGWPDRSRRTHRDIHGQRRRRSLVTGAT